MADHQSQRITSAPVHRDEVKNIEERLSVRAGSGSAAGHAMRLAAIWIALGAADDLEPNIELSPFAGVPADQTLMTLPDVSQAYQAAAQVMSTAHTIFESLLQFI